MQLNYKDFIEDWNIRFPELSQYSQTALFCKAGPILIGLKFYKAKWYFDSFEVELEMIPLWRRDAKFNTWPMFNRVLLFIENSLCLQ